MTLLLQLFLAFLNVGLFSVGGGYAAMPVISSQVIERFGWLTTDEFANLLTISEMTPGPIAVNSATFVGLRIAGIPGALVATLGCVLPSLIIVSALAVIYKRWHSLRGMQTALSTLRPVVAAVIASAALTILLNALFTSGAVAKENLDITALILFVLAFAAIRFFRVNGIIAMVCCGAAYLAVGLLAG